MKSRALVSFLVSFAVMTAVFTGAGIWLAPKLWATPAAPLPDLTIDQARLQSSVEIGVSNFKPHSCPIVNGCVHGVGSRKLLRFDVQIDNIGTADLDLGSPSDPSNAGLFVFDNCLGYYHLADFCHFELLDHKGKSVVLGRKQAFCLEDYEPIASPAPPPKYNCYYQGIQPGWSDVYDSTLVCQWLDITGVPKGKYLLRVSINGNPQQSPKFTESNYANNSATAQITIH
jgi:hypothetical protein